MVAGIITKGREDIPQWVTAFEVEFSNDGNIWNKIKDENGENKVIVYFFSIKQQK